MLCTDSGDHACVQTMVVNGRPRGKHANAPGAHAPGAPTAQASRIDRLIELVLSKAGQSGQSSTGRSRPTTATRLAQMDASKKPFENRGAPVNDHQSSRLIGHVPINSGHQKAAPVTTDVVACAEISCGKRFLAFSSSQNLLPPFASTGTNTGSLNCCE
jgi:hypothetical protein